MGRWGLVVLLAAVGCGEFEGDEPGECSDLADNDQDGAFDCDDDGCANSPECAETDADTDTDADSDTDSDTDADSDSDADTDTDTDTDTDVDSDGDGYPDDQDCAPDDASVNPGVDEVCDNGVDDNCDGSSNGCADWGLVGTLGANAVKLSGDGQNVWGQRLAVGDLDGDGGDDLVVAGWSASVGAQSSGAVYVIPGPVSAQATLASLATATIAGADKKDYLGSSVALADLDGDGTSELVVGAPATSRQSSPAKRGAYLIFSNPSGTLDATDARTTYTGEGESDAAGHAVFNLGDINGDGLDDLAMGAWGNDTLYPYDGGAAYIVMGPATAGGSLDGAGARIYGNQGNGGGEYVGTAVNGGDFDGDGTPDLIVAVSNHYNSSPSEAGALALFNGPVAGSSTVGDADTLITAPGSYNVDPGLYQDSLCADDLDGDGTDDLVIGLFDASDNGAYSGLVVIITGSGMGATESLAISDARIEGAAGESLGLSLTCPGDLDGDGSADLAVGARTESTWFDDNGMVYVFGGPFQGTEDSSDAMGQLHGQSYRAYAGAAVKAGDLNHDGQPDLVVGAYGEDNYAGGVWLVLGSGL